MELKAMEELLLSSHEDVLYTSFSAAFNLREPFVCILVMYHWKCVGTGEMANLEDPSLISITHSDSSPMDLMPFFVPSGHKEHM